MDTCFYCGENLYPDDETVSKVFGQAHVECSESEDPEEIDNI